jgi:hypothetical protein
MTSNGRPVPVETLLPRVRALAAELGELPSQNRIRTELRVGVEKARQLRSALIDLEEQEEPAATEPAESSAVDSPETSESAQVEAIAEPVREVETTETGPAELAPGAVPARAVAGGHRVRSWPVLLLALPAFVAVWSGWVGLGQLSGFGVIHPLPGIADSLTLNTAITLPIGVEAYGAYALQVWLSPAVRWERTRRFAKWSALGSLGLGMAGQGVYHLMAAAQADHAPWPIVTVVSCMPVAVLGMGAALAHLIRSETVNDGGEGR